MKQTCRSWHNKWLAKIIWKAICAQILCFAEIVFIFEEGINPFQIFLECCVVCINFSKILLQELLNETKSKRGAAVFNYFINLAKLKPNCVTQPWRQFYHEHLFSKGRLTQFLWKRYCTNMTLFFVLLVPAGPKVLRSWSPMSFDRKLEKNDNIKGQLKDKGKGTCVF